jgi:hypothetical protein
MPSFSTVVPVRNPYGPSYLLSVKIRKGRGGLKYSIVECDYDYGSTRCVNGTRTIVES